MKLTVLILVIGFLFSTFVCSQEDQLTVDGFGASHPKGVGYGADLEGRFYRFIFFLDRKTMAMMHSLFPELDLETWGPWLQSIYPFLCVFIFSGLSFELSLIYPLLGSLLFICFNYFFKKLF